VLANVASRCDFEYSFFGAVGFTRSSIKEEIEAIGLSYKAYKYLLLSVGRFLALSDEKWQDKVVEKNIMTEDALTQKLIAIFGDGKG